MQSPRAKIWAYTLDTLQTIALALAIFTLVYLFLLQPHQVSGLSMFPSFDNGEYLLTNKISYRFEKPQRGDVIIFSSPETPGEDYIKRIIGLPNDTLEIHGGNIFVNAKQLSEPYLPSSLYTAPGSFLPEGNKITLDKNEYFVMGDNRPNSSDSRRWGVVKREKIKGKAWFVYWPPKNVGVVQAVEYK